MGIADKIKSVLLGVAVGDALGVPVEFIPRAKLRENPVAGMRAYGTHNMPAGTFSDDASLTLCLAEALTEGLDLQAIARNFVKWRDEKFWTATGEVFDIGISTHLAISRLNRGVDHSVSGCFDEFENGNGSLMRIAPLLFYIEGMEVNERYHYTKQVSSITHGHIRSVIACFAYLEFARGLYPGADKHTAYKDMQRIVKVQLANSGINPSETARFQRLLDADISQVPETEIQSSGYVLHTLEAAIWCLMTTNNFEEAVLRAVNLGEDTDTTAAVCGGLAGLLYGWQQIPEEWLNTLLRRADIEELSRRLAKGLSAGNNS